MAKKEQMKPRNWDEGFGDNAGHGAEETPCADCAFRRIVTTADGRVIDTGKGSTCKAYPDLKPLEVMMYGAECPKYQKDKREKKL